jgi:hypothetical protein
MLYIKTIPHFNSYSKMNTENNDLERVEDKKAI